MALAKGQYRGLYSALSRTVYRTKVRHTVVLDDRHEQDPGSASTDSGKGADAIRCCERGGNYSNHSLPSDQARRGERDHGSLPVLRIHGAGREDQPGFAEVNRFLGDDPRGAIKSVRARSTEWFQFAEEVANCACDLIPRLEPQLVNTRQLAAALLYRRIVSAFEAVIVLAERGMHTEGLTVRRSMLEGLFVLGAIWREPKAVDAFLAKDQHRVKKILENIGRTSTPIQEAVASDLPAAEIEDRLAKLGETIKGVAVKSTKEYADAAGLLDYYYLDYSFASEAAHHVAKDLERQIAVDEHGVVDGLYWGPEHEPPSDLLSRAVQYMLNSMEAVDGVFGLSVIQELEKLQARLAALDNVTE